jgi:hypothetical protein
MPKKVVQKPISFCFRHQICADSNSPDINLQFPTNNSKKMDVRYNKEKVMDVFYRILAIPTLCPFQVRVSKKASLKTLYQIQKTIPVLNKNLEVYYNG